MNARTFDRWTTAVAHRPSRRAALRLLAGSLLGALVPCGGAVPARAVQRSDRDGDGLYDDDETNVYGTNPDVYDTDGDGVGDGEEVYLGTDPLTAPGGGCAPGECVDSVGAPPPYVEPTDPCAIQGLTNCGGLCVDLSTSIGHCGACGTVCGSGGSCQGGVCTGLACSYGQTLCDYCTDVYYDAANCLYCGRRCAAGFLCCAGSCVDISSDLNNCGACGNICVDDGFVIATTCENYQCV